MQPGGTYQRTTGSREMLSLQLRCPEADRSTRMRRPAMSQLATIVTLAGLITVTPALSQTAVPDLRGTWKGESETIILGTGNAHHGSTSSPAPRLSSVPFTLTIDKQEGRRFSGTLSLRGTETVIAVISQSGTIYMVD